jgi:hypothetical protein
MKPKIVFDDDDDMNGPNAPYFRMWQDRYKSFCDNWYLYIEFSPGYFENLKRELESEGYEVTIVGSEFWHPIPVDRQVHCWYSPPVGDFGVNPRLTGESFVFIAM